VWSNLNSSLWPTPMKNTSLAAIKLASTTQTSAGNTPAFFSNQGSWRYLDFNRPLKLRGQGPISLSIGREDLAPVYLFTPYWFSY
jgi:hypothetical protein